MGFGVNSDFQINSSQLQPLSIPLGSATVAKATTEATLQGALTPSGTVADTASIVQTAPLTDANIGQPSNTLQATVLNGQQSGGDLTGTYQYYVTFFNSTNNTESRPSAVETSPPMTGGQISLGSIPTPPAGSTWTDVRIYRNTTSVPGNTNFYEIADLTASGVTSGYTFTDNNTDQLIIAGTPNNPGDGVANTINTVNILNFNGPPASSTTLLSNLLEYDASTGGYNNVFSLPAATATDPNPTATLSFTGTVGGNSLPAQTFTITGASTVKDLAKLLARFAGHPVCAGHRPQQSYSRRWSFQTSARRFDQLNGQITVVVKQRDAQRRCHRAFGRCKRPPEVLPPQLQPSICLLTRFKRPLARGRQRV